MLEQITIGQIAVAVSVIVSLFSGVAVSVKNLKKWSTRAFDGQMAQISDRLDAVSARVDIVDRENCKNYLVRFLSDVEKGADIDEIEKERFYEQYEHYTASGGNSYIKQKVKRLQDAGKL